MLTNIIIVVLAVIVISDGTLNFKPTKNPKPGIDVAEPSSCDMKGG